MKYVIIVAFALTIIACRRPGGTSDVSTQDTIGIDSIQVDSLTVDSIKTND